MSKAYVLLSGGIDSTTCLANACQVFKDSVKALIMSYGQRHLKETAHAISICSHYGIKHQIVDAKGVIGVGGLTDDTLEMPNASYADLPKGVSPTYVPFRNGLFLSIAASIASADPEAVVVYYGAHAEDAENDAYPDCSIPFIRAIGRAIDIGTYGKLKLYAPLMIMTKAQIIVMGEYLKVPWRLTWSCYEGGLKHCGTCPTCRSRRDGFILAEVDDPTEYAA